MKRRQFLKYIGGAAVMAAVPLSLAAKPRSDSLSLQYLKDLRATLEAHAVQPMEDGAYYAVVDPATYKHLKLMAGEIGHYEGFNLVETPMITKCQVSMPGNSAVRNLPSLHERRSGACRRAPAFINPGRKTYTRTQT